jgi:PPOX class probable F420-dependent enzyme
VTDAVPPEAERLLTSEPLVAYLATCADGRPHVAPVWYRYEDGIVEITTTGRKLENLRANPRAAVAVQKDERGHTRWMVTLLGTAEIVEDEAANREATQRINDKYGVHGEAWSENTLVRIDVGSATYRRYDE